MKKVLYIFVGIGLIAILAACSPSIPSTGSNPTSAPTMAMPTSGSTTAPAVPASTSSSAGTEVSIANFAFSPDTLTVKAGTTVMWTNHDTTAHTVTADDKSFDSGNLQPGQSFSFMFTQAGTFSYHCSIHPNMKATIVVTGG
jgi:plastocyanin